ncbi:MAG: 50S ribosomal protein L22 [Armatimonadota bacterium]|nr:50S ribosomal protein L22 [Armatimonadota bacterium]MDR7449495.1 50S ribosomal protein L22 [Armatimonadota bacterium]MDR7459974.1 50S ribosomal protein L22 [Armatimonadota bacterium]MDR7480693.1 50S ribosomal protein L22 [Armatimonadota bacterium]MDR7489693.1 50S ribosomal protein L22 [Armatimonadota bacterium]
MGVRATARYVRISPRKVQRVAALIRGLPVREAEARLQVLPQRAARVLAKVLRSAVANAEHNAELARDDLVVTRAYADTGPSLKRLMPRARGRADVIVRRSSHVTVEVDERRAPAR